MAGIEKVQRALAAQVAKVGAESAQASADPKRRGQSAGPSLAQRMEAALDMSKTRDYLTRDLVFGEGKTPPTGTLPMSFRWRRGGSTLTNAYPSFRNFSFLTLRNLTAGNTNVTVVITNAANTGGAVQLHQVAYLFVVADTDGEDLLGPGDEGAPGLSTAFEELQLTQQGGDVRPRCESLASGRIRQRGQRHLEGGTRAGKVAQKPARVAKVHPEGPNVLWLQNPLSLGEQGLLQSACLPCLSGFCEG